MSKPTIQQAIEGISSLPTLPTILTKVLAAAADPDASAVDLSQHIAADQTLSAEVLKLVNSAYYGLRRQVDSITTAIVMLGFFEVRNVALAVTAFRNFPGANPDYDRTQLWRHSLATAMAADRLAKTLRLPAERAFIAGLLHDIGKVVFDALYPQEFREAAHQAHQQGRFIRDTEPEVLGLTHADAGALLADHWDLPPAIVDAIRHHHAPERSDNDPELTALAALADFTAYQADLGETSNGREPEAPDVSATLTVADEHLCAIAEDLKKSHDRINQFLGALGR